MASRQRERQGSYSALPQPQKWPRNNRTGNEESVSRNVERSLAPLETAPRLSGPRQRSNDQNKKGSSRLTINYDRCANSLDLQKVAIADRWRRTK